MGLFRASGKNDEAKNTNEHNTVKNPNWQKADQLAFYKRVKGVEFSAYREQHHVHRTGLETAP